MSCLPRSAWVGEEREEEKRIRPVQLVEERYIFERLHVQVLDDRAGHTNLRRMAAMKGAVLAAKAVETQGNAVP